MEIPFAMVDAPDAAIRRLLAALSGSGRGNFQPVRLTPVDLRKLTNSPWRRWSAGSKNIINVYILTCAECINISNPDWCNG